MKIRGRSLSVCLGLLCLTAARGQQYTIQTLAGTGAAAFVGDSGPPSAAQLSSPSGVALDSSGNVYIADSGNHCIRKISGNTITTIAGIGGTAGYSGDGAAATSAYLNSPAGIAFDSKGNLYIADTVNNVIRKVAGATISTYAGIAGQGGGFAGDNGAATSANLNRPTAMAFDSADNMYIADTDGSYIRRVDAKTGIITTYVGISGGSSGTAGKLSSPNGLVLDSSGALYIADSGNNRLAKFVAPAAFSNFAGNLTSGFKGDGGQAISAQLAKPTGITMDAAGSIYFADTNNGRIRKITSDGIINTIAGKTGAGYTGDGGSAIQAALNFPRSVAVGSNGTIYIADTGNHAIRVLSPTYPVIGANGVTNAASFATRISPGAIASIFGSGFGTSTFQADDGLPWPTTTNSLVSVKVNGVAAPLYYVSPGQINFQVPWATPTTGTVNVAVVVNGGSSNVINVPVATAAPGLFVLPSGQAAVENQDYSINDPSNPAKVGATIFAYLTGSGPVSPAAKDGVPASTTSLVYAQASTSATIGNLPATISFAGLAPGFVGLVQMNIVVPTGLAPGTYPLSVTIDGQTSNAAPITVK
jgi:uncharacterized protein (TIGR03437 family)